MNFRWAMVALAAVCVACGCVRGPSVSDRSRQPEFPTLARAEDAHAWATFQAALTRPSRDEGAPSGAVEAFRYRAAQRQSERGGISYGALERAFDQISLSRSLRGGPRAAGTYSGSWTWIGPGGIGGRLRAVLMHPSEPGTLWVGTAGGGIWKTTNGGTTWSPMDDFMASVAIGCMALDPTDPDVLYAGTGEGFFDEPEGSSNTATMRGLGVFKSIDGGVTWDRMPSTANPDFAFVNRLAIHPTNPQILLAATSTGIWRSTDRGGSWTRRAVGWFLDLQMDPNDPNNLVAGRSHTGGYYSTDNGASWTPSAGLDGDRQEFAYSDGTPGLVYAARSENGAIKLYRSTDGGQSYALRTSGGGIATYSHYNNTVWADPTNPNTVVVGGVYLYRSTDGGQTLTRTFTAVHADMHAIEHAPGFNGTTNRRLYVGCDGGIYRIDDAYGSAATRINGNLGVTQFYGAAVSNASGTVLAGAQDNGTNRFTGNPLAWNSNVIGGDGGFCAADPFNSNYFYGGSQYANLRRSVNGGASFSGMAPPGAGSANNYNFIPYFMIDPNEGNRMLVCGEFLWRNNAVRSGNTWTSIKPSIRPQGRPILMGGGEPQAHFAGNNPWNLSTVAVAEGNSDVIWAGHNDGTLFKTSNGTAAAPTWTRVDENGVGLPDRWISRIVINRADSNDVAVSFMGFEPDNIWRTTDGGTTWTPMTGSGLFALPAVPVSGLAQHRLNPDWWYAGTDFGIFTSSDHGSTWTTVTDGPGTVPIDELVWKNDSTLMAVTHGRGVFLGTVALGVEPFSPVEFLVGPGLHVGGRVQSVFLSDDRYLVAMRDLSRDAVGDDVTAVFEGVAPIPSASSLDVRLESRAGQSGLRQTIDLFDHVAGQWVRISTGTATTVDGVVTASAPSPAGRFVHPATRRVRMRLGWNETVAETAVAWRVWIDEVRFTATP